MIFTLTHFLSFFWARSLAFTSSLFKIFVAIFKIHASHHAYTILLLIFHTKAEMGSHIYHFEWNPPFHLILTLPRLSLRSAWAASYFSSDAQAVYNLYSARSVKPPMIRPKKPRPCFLNWMFSLAPMLPRALKSNGLTTVPDLVTAKGLMQDSRSLACLFDSTPPSSPLLFYLTPPYSSFGYDSAFY